MKFSVLAYKSERNKKTINNRKEEQDKKQKKQNKTQNIESAKKESSKQTQGHYMKSGKQAET